ncbi:MAG TPA: hypothetical protein RMH99_13290 [Sandaracinaceae bacterium LLY-WYZ-13_1]|nr:hypothetical protein [Sandaracinaceae bacterium LLY-WYZ-13_1]
MTDRRDPRPRASSRELSSPEPRSEETDRLYARLQQTLADERGPRAWLRARPTPWRLAIVGVALLGVVTAAVLVTGHTAFLRALDARWIASVVGLAAMSGVAVTAALRPAHRPEGSRAVRAALGAGVVLGALGAILLLGDGTLGALERLRCLAIGGAAAVPIFALARLVDRTPQRGAGFAALAAGVAGALTVQVICPAPGLAHLVVSHFGVVVLAAGALGLFARLGRARLRR